MPGKAKPKAKRTSSPKTARKAATKPKAAGKTVSRAKAAPKTARKPASRSKVSSMAKMSKPTTSKTASAAPRATAGATTSVRLLSGGNPQIAKSDGEAPVQAYIAAMPDWKRDIGRRLDTLITTSVPNVTKAVKWNSPFYGMKGQGWFVSFHVFNEFVKVTFFRGTSLKPPVEGGTGKDARWIDIHENDLNEAQLSAWVKQAAALPGWGKS